MISSERLYTGAFAHVPNANGLVFRCTQYQLLSRMEGTAAYIVVVASARIDFPRLRLIHSPHFNQPIISCSHYQRHCWMEASPIDATIVALKDTNYTALTAGTSSFTNHIHNISNQKSNYATSKLLRAISSSCSTFFLTVKN